MRFAIHIGDMDRDELLRRLLAAEQRAEAAEQEAKQLREGTYYSSLERVWERVPMTETTWAHLDALFRQIAPKGHNYEVTVQEATKDDNSASDSARTSTTTESPNHPDKVFPTDIFGTINLRAQVAHLIPASTIYAGMYDDVAACALGLINNKRLEPEDLEVKQRAIHGSTANSGGQKIKHTGLKHSNSNKIRLRGQKEYLDDIPCVVIVPIMSLEEMKRWNNEEGGTYDAVVLAEAWKKDSIQNVCNGIGLTNKAEANEIASIDEIEMAGNLLEQVICGLAFSLLHRDRTFPRRPETTKKFNDLKNQFTNVLGGIMVPAMTGNTLNLRVRKVTFGRPGMHPMPDPFLLTTKAAVVWSTRCGQQLLAGGEVQDDMDTLSTEDEVDGISWLPLPCFNLKELEDLDLGLDQPQADCSDVSMDSELVDEDRTSRCSICRE